MVQKLKNIAIITGASSGIGKEFAFQLSDPQFNIDEFWLIARRKSEMLKLSEKIKSKFPEKEFKIIELDLTQLDKTEQTFKELFAPSNINSDSNIHSNSKSNFSIKWFINNAGFGLIGFFEKLDLKKQLEMIQLNVTSMTQLTGLVLPHMKSGSHIVITASSAGFFPLPTFAVYGATKAYVVNFANALANELMPKNISVTAVCPGPVKTEFFDVAFENNKALQAKNKMTALGMAEVQDVVKKAIADSQKQKIRSTYGLLINSFVALSGLIPRRLLKSKLGLLLHK